MARSIWNGTIAFGLMTVPVKLHTATESKTVSFREVDLDDSSRIEHRRFCSKRTRRSRTRRTARTSSYSRTRTSRPPRRAGPARSTSRRSSTSPTSTRSSSTTGRKPAKAQLDAATKLIEALGVHWDPERYRDCYRERLLDVIERKRKGRKITAPSSSGAAGPPPDIMDALKKSLARVQAGEGFDRADDDAGGGLDGLTRDELYERAQKEDVAGRSSMSRRELIEALSE